MDRTYAAWNQALLFAVTGMRHPELGEQERPDLDLVLEQVWTAPRVRAGEESPTQPGARAFPVPPDLARGIGPAQFTAALSDLRRRLRATELSPTVVADRPLNRDELRLAADAPPHHG